ncbi:Uroporphyrinogen-III synthase [Frankliniella fusca]|uniref:Uroporphyrinogen-III synthase n=1 Tax=Frankliniella fusca TaxID=407009 RepID=A0AAE1I2I0_9NEOP|nr:Uroporphyrinogen-III synthase [Frankliniella fusca]
MKILVLRAPKETLDEADPYIDEFRKAGLNAEGLDVLSFQFINQDILREKLLHPENYSGLVFTSPRGVVSVAQCFEKAVDDLKSWSVLPSYVVGEGTAQVLREKLALSSFGKESGNAGELAQYICHVHKPEISKPLLFPSAELKRNILLNSLIDAGIAVDCVTSYKTVPHPQLSMMLQNIFQSSAPKPDCLVFFSPSGARAALSVLKKVGVNFEIMQMVAIGPTTEAAIIDEGFSVFATASKPSPTGLLEAINGARSNAQDAGMA